MYLPYSFFYIFICKGKPFVKKIKTCVLCVIRVFCVQFLLLIWIQYCEIRYFALILKPNK